MDLPTDIILQKPFLTAYNIYLGNVHIKRDDDQLAIIPKLLPDPLEMIFQGPVANLVTHFLTG